MKGEVAYIYKSGKSLYVEKWVYGIPFTVRKGKTRSESMNSLR